MKRIAKPVYNFMVYDDSAKPKLYIRYWNEVVLEEVNGISYANLL